MKTRWIMLSKYFPAVAPISNVNHDSRLNFSGKKNLQFKGVHLKKKKNGRIIFSLLSTGPNLNCRTTWRVWTGPDLIFLEKKKLTKVPPVGLDVCFLKQWTSWTFWWKENQFRLISDPLDAVVSLFWPAHRSAAICCLFWWISRAKIVPQFHWNGLRN